MNMNLMNLIQEGKIKRYLRSRKKLNFPGLISHITQHAAGRDPLFLEDADFLYFLKLLKEIAESFHLSVFCFCPMTNHLHLLMRQEEKNLPEAMHDLFMRYAFYFNNKYARRGHLFSGPFGQAACFDDYYLLASSLYIHLNPVRAGMVSDYFDYRWSTWRLYCQEGDPDTFVNSRFILEMVDSDLTSAKRKYRDLLIRASHYQGGEVQEIKNSIGKFSIWIRKKFPGLINKSSIAGELISLPEGYVSDRELEEAISSLRGKKRLTKPGDIKTRKFTIEQLKARGFSVAEIVEYLGISRASIYNILSPDKT